MKTADLQITNFVLGILRHGPSKPSLIHQEAMQFDPEVRLMAVHNAGRRLEDDGVVKRDDDAWSLVDKAQAPLIFGDHAWGPPSIFAGKEQASYRRAFLLHAIRSFKGGLQVMQVVKAAEESADYKLTKISKDMVMDDLAIMKELGLVDKVEETRKWIAVEPPSSSTESFSFGQ